MSRDCVTILFLLFAIPLKGCVLICLWLWFIVPFGVAEIGMAHAIGLTIAIDAFTSKTIHEINAKRMEEMFANLFLMPTLMLAVGYACHVMM